MINWKYVAKRFARRAYNWRCNFRSVGADNAANIKQRDFLAAALLQQARERDKVTAQLRVDLEEARREAAEWHDGPIGKVADQRDRWHAQCTQLRADLVAAQRTVAMLREDAARVQGRLREATVLLNDAFLPDFGAWQSARHAFLASVSSTGEAHAGPKAPCAECGQDWGAGVHDYAHPYKAVVLGEPAAPEPAPAPCQHHRGCEHEYEVLGEAVEQSPIPAAAPASAQGAGEQRPGTCAPWCGKNYQDRSVPILMMARAEMSERTEGFAYLEGAAPTDVWCTRACRDRGVAKKAAPPQPAPVERHAFVAGTGTFADFCYHVGKGGTVCGQPRSAAVHGEGEK